MRPCTKGVRRVEAEHTSGEPLTPARCNHVDYTPKCLRVFSCRSARTNFDLFDEVIRQLETGSAVDHVRDVKDIDEIIVLHPRRPADVDTLRNPSRTAQVRGYGSRRSGAISR